MSTYNINGGSDTALRREKLAIFCYKIASNKEVKISDRMSATNLLQETSSKYQKEIFDFYYSVAENKEFEYAHRLNSLRQCEIQKKLSTKKEMLSLYCALIKEEHLFIYDRTRFANTLLKIVSPDDQEKVFALQFLYSKENPDIQERYKAGEELLKMDRKDLL